MTDTKPPEQIDVKVFDSSKNWHNCHFCGEVVSGGYTPKGERHWLSDCRPDLVEHEPGPLCTWPTNVITSADGEKHLVDLPLDDPSRCYAPHNEGKNHVYKDGPT